MLLFSSSIVELVLLIIDAEASMLLEELVGNYHPLNPDTLDFFFFGFLSLSGQKYCFHLNRMGRKKLSDLPLPCYGLVEAGFFNTCVDVGLHSRLKRRVIFVSNST